MSLSTSVAGASTTVRSLPFIFTARSVGSLPALIPPNQISSPFGDHANPDPAFQPRERTRFLPCVSSTVTAKSPTANAVGDFAVTVLDTHGKKRVLSRGWKAASGLAWSPKGDEIWFGGIKAGSEPTLRAVKMNGSERTVVEAPATLVLKDITHDGRVLVTAE